MARDTEDHGEGERADNPGHDGRGNSTLGPQHEQYCRSSTKDKRGAQRVYRTARQQNEHANAARLIEARASTAAVHGTAGLAMNAIATRLVAVAATKRRPSRTSSRSSSSNALSLRGSWTV